MGTHIKLYVKLYSYIIQLYNVKVKLFLKKSTENFLQVIFIKKTLAKLQEIVYNSGKLI